MPPRQRSCKAHPTAAAGWRCIDCHAPLCPRCTASKRAQTVYYPVCTLCGGAAEPLKVARAERSYAQRLRGVWRYPLTPAGLITLAAAGLIVYLLSFLGSRGAWLGTALLWSYVFTLIRRTASGDDSLDPPDFSDLGDIIGPGVRGALATAVLWVPASLYLHASYGSVEEALEAARAEGLSQVAEQAAPAERLPDVGDMLDAEQTKLRAIEEARRAVASAQVRSEELEEDLEALAWEREEREAADALEQPGAEAHEATAPGPRKVPWKDPIVYLLAVLGVLWMPVAILSSAAGGSLLQMVNPLRPVLVALRIPREYLVAVGACLLVALAGLVLALLGALLNLLPVPVLPGWVAASLGVYAPLVAGRVLGLLLVVRGAELGYLREEDVWELALPGVEPQGKLPAAFGGAAAQEPSMQEEGAPVEERAPAPRRRHAPIELDEEPAPVAQPAPRPAPAERVMGVHGLEASGPAAAAAVVAAGAMSSAVRTASERLRAAVDAQALAQALQLYPAALREPGAVVAADCHYAVGRHAATQGQYPLAVQALRAACAAQPAGPLAAQSLVLMARVLGERMGDSAGAQRVYQHVVQHYPQSDAARFARERLPTAAG